MNSKRKKRVSDLLTNLKDAQAELTAIYKAEQKARETSPLPKGEQLDNSISLLDTATGDLKRVINGLGDIG